MIPCERAYASIFATDILIPSCLNGSISPDIPALIFWNATSVSKLKNEAISPARPAKVIDISEAAFCATPDDFSIAIMVPE